MLTHFCLKISLTNVVYTYDIFENNFGINHELENYLLVKSFVNFSPLFFKIALEISLISLVALGAPGFNELSCQAICTLHVQKS